MIKNMWYCDNNEDHISMDIELVEVVKCGCCGSGVSGCANVSGGVGMVLVHY